MKKARVATSAATARAAQRPPVPRVPSNYTSKTGATKGKENDDLDALTSGLKRITLKLPPKEEYEAREREKEEKRAAEASKRAPAKTATRKPAAPRTTTAKPAAVKPATAKRGPGRPPKSSKPASPVDPGVLAPTPEPPKLQSAANAALVQPQPVQADSVSSLVQPPPSHSGAVIADPSSLNRHTSASLTEPPTEKTPIEQLRSQLPKSFFITSSEPQQEFSAPPRADTPPPPPPAMSDFVNYTSHSFAPPAALGDAKTTELPPSAPLQWLPPNTESGPTSSTGSRPMSPATRRQDLPVFTANGVIPFANPRAGDGYQGVNKEDIRHDLWDIPDTPAR
jgi:histone deacetylase HOS3